MAKESNMAKTKEVDQTTPITTEVVEAALTADQILAKPRSEIRYALGRMVAGNPEGRHKQIYEFYRPTLEQYELKMYEFSVDWDLSKDDWRNIVSGHIVRKYQEELNASLFTTDGSLK